MNNFIATISTSDDKRYYIGKWGKDIIRRTAISHAFIFEDAEQALKAAKAAALENDTVHIFPFVLGGEVLFAEETKS